MAVSVAMYMLCLLSDHYSMQKKLGKSESAVHPYIIVCSCVYLYCCTQIL